jgi:hypothetical protein
MQAYATPVEGAHGSPTETVTVGGLELLLLGWGGIFETKPAWLANPLLLLAIFFSWRSNVSPRRAGIAVAAATLASAFALLGQVPLHWEFGDDHGVNGASYPLIGARVWAASCFAASIAVAIKLLPKSGQSS